MLWNKIPKLVAHEIFPVSLEMKHGGVRRLTTATSPLYILSSQVALAETD